jgi:hypothetical protein
VPERLPQGSARYMRPVRADVGRAGAVAEGARNKFPMALASDRISQFEEGAAGKNAHSFREDLPAYWKLNMSIFPLIYSSFSTRLIIAIVKIA